MADELEQLFGEGSGAPRARTTRAVVVLVGGLALAVLGMGCTAVPGGMLVLVSWYLVQKELDRVDSGYLALSDRPALQTLRTFVFLALALVVVLFLVQGILLWLGFYENLWSGLLVGASSAVGGGPPVPPTP